MNNQDRYETTTMSAGRAVRTDYYCRGCGADCGYMDRAGHDTTHECPCWQSRQATTDIPVSAPYFTATELLRLRFAKWAHETGRLFS